MSNTAQQLAEAKSAVGNVAHHHRSAWVSSQALRSVLEERARSLTAAFSQHPAPDPLDIGNGTHHAFLTAREAASDYVALRVSLDLLEGTDDFKQGAEIINPLVAKVRDLEAQLQAEEAEASRAIKDRMDALAAAKAEAIAKIEADFAEPAPSPAPPFRGKNIRPALATA
jgi:CII-binding regulator of phage lambda lysogenization HflD